jgi:hypothetical protein
MNARTIVEGEYLDASGADDPDLNQAFWDFAESIKQEADAGGSVAVFEVPTDANGTPRPTTYNKTKLFTVPIGSCTLDDICDRVLREFVEPGGKIMIQLLARKNGERGVKMNKMIPLKRSKFTGNENTGNAGQIENLMRMMNEQRARDLADMRSMIEQTRAPSIDPMTQALSITAKLTEMAVAMKSGTVVGAAPATDPNAMMTQMMGIMMTGMMKKFMAGMDGSDKPQATENNSWLKEIAELAKPLLEARAVAEKTNLVNAQRMLRHEASAPAAQAPPANESASTDAPPIHTPTPKEQNDMKLLALLNSALPMLIDGIVLKNGSATDTAKLLMDEIPEDDAGLNDALYQLIQSPAQEFNAKLCLADKRAADHAPWFESLRVALLSEFDPDTRVPQTEKGAA